MKNCKTLFALVAVCLLPSAFGYSTEECSDLSCEAVITHFDINESTPLGLNAADLSQRLEFNRVNIEYKYKEGNASGWFGVLFSSLTARSITYRGWSEACNLECSQIDPVIEIDVTVGLFTEDKIFTDAWAVTLRSWGRGRFNIDGGMLSPNDIKGNFYNEYRNPLPPWTLDGFMPISRNDDSGQIGIFHFEPFACAPTNEGCLYAWVTDVWSCSENVDVI